jgi:hypothetical protein
MIKDSDTGYTSPLVTAPRGLACLKGRNDVNTGEVM